MYLHTKYIIPTSKNIGDTHVFTGHETGWMEGRTEGRTVRLLYASLSYFGGVKNVSRVRTSLAKLFGSVHDKRVRVLPGHKL